MKRKLYSVVATAIACMSLLTACGSGLSGKYVSAATDMNYYDFKSGGKVIAGQLGVTMEGKYEVEDNTVSMRFVQEMLGVKIPIDMQLTINENGDLVDNSLGIDVIYSK